MSYLVRTATQADLLQVLQVLSRADEGRRPLPTEPTDEEVSMWERMMSTDDVTVYVADLDGELVGSATFLMLPNITYDCRPTGFIEAMVVKVAHRRRGVALAVLTRLLDDARQHGCHKIQLLSNKGHATDGAHDLYRAAGFEAEAEGFRLYLESREPGCRMPRRIGNAISLCERRPRVETHRPDGRHPVICRRSMAA